jgi:outer membrane protein
MTGSIKFLKLFFFVILLISVLDSTLAQNKTMTLQECIEYAMEKNLRIKQGGLNLGSSMVDHQLAKESRLPSLNGGTTYGFRFGRTIDPTTNSFETSALNTNGFSLNSGMLLFNGNRINNTIKQAEASLRAGEKDLGQIKNDVALDVTTAYLNVLMALENLTISENNREIALLQLDMTRKMIDSGIRPGNEIYEIESQVARNELLEINAQNNLDLAYLSLYQTMMLDVGDDFIVDRPEIAISENALAQSVDNIFEMAMQSQPEIAAGEYRIQSAMFGERISKAAYYPTLSLFGNINTNYSSLSRKLDGFIPTLTAPTQIILDGELRQVEFFQLSPVLTSNPYFNQLSENLGVGVGLQLSIPIYDNGRIRAGVERARLNQKSAEIQLDQAKLQLRNTVERAVTDAKAAKKNFEANEKNVRALERVWKDTERRFNIGTSNSFEFNTAFARYQSGQLELIVAKYDYIFKLKLIEFYLGQGITL